MSFSTSSRFSFGKNVLLCLLRIKILTSLFLRIKKIAPTKTWQSRQQRRTTQKYCPQNLFFHQRNTEWAFRHMKLTVLKRILQVESIDGIWFNVSCQAVEFEPECGLIDMTSFDHKIQKKEKQLTFYIQQINYYFTVTQDPKDTFKTFTTKIANQLNKEFKVVINPCSMLITYLDQQMKENIVSFHNFSKLTRKDQIFLKFTNEVKISRRIYNNQDSFILIQFGQYKNKFAYGQIRALKLTTIFDKYLQLKEKGLNSIEYGLRIHDLIVKPCESLSSHPILDKLFLVESRYVKIVLGQVVREQFMFYAQLQTMGELIGQNEALFNKLVHKSIQNQVYRYKCIDIIKIRAQSAKHSAFKNNQKRIQPILYYTSQLLIKDQEKQMKLYYAQNRFLREMRFGLIERKQYNKWQFLFANSLIKNLLLLKEHKGQLYRGISHKQKHKVGQIMTYKQFNSCSTDIESSLKFAKTTLYILQNCLIGRQIKEYSYYNKEEQILNLPYASYKITNISSLKHENQQIQLVTMQQCARPPLSLDMKDQRQLFVLWVDGDNGQGILKSKNINCVRQTTFFIHMRSTTELDQWLIQNKQRLDNQTISSVLITNMFRVQNQVPNQYAGVMAIKSFTRHQPKGKVLVYIGNIEKTKEKLKKYQIPAGNQVKISNNKNELAQFLFDQCGIS